VPRHNPETPLPDPTQEAYVQARAKGMGPTQAAKASGLERYRQVERQTAFRERLRILSGEAASDPTLTLQYLVLELKRTAAGARAAGQYKNSNEALSQLAELYARHPELRGESAAERVPSAPGSRRERRTALRGRLAVVPGSANE